VAADADEFQAARTIGAGRFVPLGATSEDLRDVGEGFDVVDDGWLLKKTSLAGEGRLVAWIGTMAFEGLKKRGLFAANVAAGADEYFEVKVEVAAEDFLAEDARFATAANFLAEDFFLERILMADIEDALSRAGDEAGDDHAFGYEMGEMGENEAVLDGAGFAFVGVANDVFGSIGLPPDEVPFHPRGKTGAA